MDKICKMEGDYHEQRRTTWFLWEEDVAPSDIHRRLSAVCGQKAAARSTVFSWARGVNSGKETAQATVDEWQK
jgi:hypothetical protein